MAVRSVLLALLIAVATCSHAAVASATEYRVTPLPVGFSPVAMNDWGTVIGQGPGDGHYVWKRRSLTLIPGLPGYPEIQPADISDLGVVVGTAYAADSNSRPFRWTRARGTRDLGGPLLSECNAGYQKDYYVAAVNNTSVVVGQIGDTDCPTKAVRWVGGRMEYLPGLQLSSSASDVNDYGWIVGFETQSDIYGPPAPLLGFLWHGGHVVRAFSFDSLTEATAINNDGVVVGDDLSGGWVWSSQRGMRSLGAVWAPLLITTSAIAGTTPDGVAIWNIRGGHRQLIADLPHGWALDTISDMNERGQLLGMAHRSDGEQRGVVLTPVS